MYATELKLRKHSGELDCLSLIDDSVVRFLDKELKYLAFKSFYYQGIIVIHT